ncbi:hypothetical protein MKW92_023504 [Papaver armeniacum]|nr:hypothetical protein MKW92_023504 [Papaver armeniacum]
MATASMLTHYSLNVNPLLRTRTQIHYQLIIKNRHFLIKRPESNNFRVFEEKEEKERKENSWDEIIEVILKTLNLFIQKTAISGVILGLLMTYDPYSALAASGGRMGGRAFLVALLGATRSLQKDLDKIAEVADTSTRSGLSYILQESMVALLRHIAYCFSSYSSVDVKPDKVDGEKLFNKLTTEERAKFDEETLVNVDNIKKRSTPTKNPNGLSSDYIVMTILVAVMGEYKLRAFNSSESLKQALMKLGSFPTSKILAVEVMWTPQEENDTLTEREMLKDYPRLRPLV